MSTVPTERKIYKVRGRAMWARLAEPDYTYKEEGEFKIKVVIDEPQADDLNDALSDVLSEQLETVVSASKNPAAARKQIKIKNPARLRHDENGDETDEYEVNISRRAVIVRKKDGKEFKQVIPVFLGKGIKAPADIQIGNGSEVIVTFTARPYYMAANKEVGVSLDLEAVLIKKLVEYQGKDASDMFDDEDFDGCESLVVEAETVDEKEEETPDTKKRASAPAPKVTPRQKAPKAPEYETEDPDDIPF